MINFISYINIFNMTKEEAAHLSNVLKAYSEGKVIQIHLPNDKWVDVPYPTFDRHPSNYRIKPEPKYRPYKSAEEFLKAQKEHGVYLKFDKYYHLPLEVSDEYVYIKYVAYSYKRLLEDYMFEDGTPCGVLENE